MRGNRTCARTQSSAEQLRISAWSSSQSCSPRAHEHSCRQPAACIAQRAAAYGCIASCATSRTRAHAIGGQQRATSGQSHAAATRVRLTVLWVLACSHRALRPVSHGCVGQGTSKSRSSEHAEPCERSAHDADQLGDDRQAQVEKARHRVVRGEALRRARLVHERVGPRRRSGSRSSSLSCAGMSVSRFV